MGLGNSSLPVGGLLRGLCVCVCDVCTCACVCIPFLLLDGPSQDVFDVLSHPDNYRSSHRHVPGSSTLLNILNYEGAKTYLVTGYSPPIRADSFSTLDESRRRLVCLICDLTTMSFQNGTVN